MEPGKARVLVVDDDEVTLRLVRGILTRDGHQVLSTRDAAQAIEIARSESPDIILMDVLMPGMDGYTALGAIRQDTRTGRIPVVMLSGIDLAMNKKLAEGLGANGYLTKPFSRKDLLEVVAQSVSAGAGQAGDI